MSREPVPGGAVTDSDPAPYDEIDAFAEWGFRAFTTTRAAGSFAVAGDEPVGQVMGRWRRLREELGAAGGRLATATQVHGATVLEHDGGWHGWLRGDAADGHLSLQPATSFAVSVADCVPVFVAHPSGAGALLHAGWRGVAAGILERGVALLGARGLAASELRVHVGPAICADCYEVGPEVVAALTGAAVAGPSRVDLRALLADRARAIGVRHVSASAACTRCDGERFYSHRAGDAGRQLGVLATPLERAG